MWEEYDINGSYFALDGTNSNNRILPKSKILTKKEDILQMYRNNIYRSNFLLILLAYL